MNMLTFHTTKIRDKNPISRKYLWRTVCKLIAKIKSGNFDLETWPVLHDDEIETLIKHNPNHTNTGSLRDTPYISY